MCSRFSTCIIERYDCCPLCVECEVACKRNIGCLISIRSTRTISFGIPTYKRITVACKLISIEFCNFVILVCLLVSHGSTTAVGMERNTIYLFRPLRIEGNRRGRWFVSIASATNSCTTSCGVVPTIEIITRACSSRQSNGLIGTAGCEWCNWTATAIIVVIYGFCTTKWLGSYYIRNYFAVFSNRYYIVLIRSTFSQSCNCCCSCSNSNIIYNYCIIVSIAYLQFSDACCRTWCCPSQSSSIGCCTRYRQISCRSYCTAVSNVVGIVGNTRSCSCVTIFYFDGLKVYCLWTCLAPRNNYLASTIPCKFIVSSCSGNRRTRITIAWITCPSYFYTYISLYIWSTRSIYGYTCDFTCTRKSTCSKSHWFSRIIFWTHLLTFCSVVTIITTIIAQSPRNIRQCFCSICVPCFRCYRMSVCFICRSRSSWGSCSCRKDCVESFVTCNTAMFWFHLCCGAEVIIISCI